MGFLTVGLLALAVFVGAATQRLTGLGFALVAAPMLVLVAGPLQGVLLSNALSLVINVVLAVMLRRDIDVRRAVLLAIPALIVVPIGAWVAARMSPALLSMMIGGLVVVALSAVVSAPGLRVRAGRGAAIGAGAASGFMNVTAGVGGPALSLYAIATRWHGAGFVASAQLYFALLNAGSLIAKGELPHLGTAGLVACTAGLVVGAVTGHLLAPHVAPSRVRQAIIVLAFAGALATVVRGMTQLISG